MSRPRTLVSGGTGFVGRFIVEGLLAAGHAVTVMGRSSPGEGFFSAPVRFVEGRLDPDRDQSAAFEGIDNFVHAAFDHVAGKYRGGEGDDPAGFRRRNVEGTAALFEAARVKRVERAVFLSSRAVYGSQTPGAELTEETVPHPDTLYGEVKLAGEQRLRAMGAAAFVGTSLRITGVYGPAGQGRPHKWAELFSDYLAGRTIEPRAATEVHGADVARAVRLALEAKPDAVQGQVFNVSDIVTDTCAILAVVREATGSAAALPPPVSAAALNVMTTEKLRSLGWKPGGAELFRKTVMALAAETRS